MNRLISFMAILSTVALSLPILVLAWVSFSPVEWFDFAIGERSVRWYAQALHEPVWREAFARSLGVAVVASAAATFAALGVVIGPQLRGAERPDLPRFAAALLLLPMLLPPVALGIGTLILVQRFAAVVPFDLGLGPLVLLHAALQLPVSYLVLRQGMARLRPEWLPLARGYGATDRQCFAKVIWPHLRRDVLTAFAFGVVLSFNEAIVTQFLAPADAQTLPRVIWPKLRYALSPVVAAVALLSLGFFVVVGGAVFAWSRRRRG